MKIILMSNALDIMKDYNEASEELKKGMKLQMFRAMSILKAQIQDNIRTSMNVRTGTLLNSIQSQVLDRGSEIIGEVGPENVPYAQIQEEGGEIEAHFIKPTIKKALKFEGKGGTFFSKGHFMPAIQIKPKYYLRDAVESHADYIAEKFGIFIQDTLKEA